MRHPQELSPLGQRPGEWRTPPSSAGAPAGVFRPLGARHLPAGVASSTGTLWETPYTSVCSSMGTLSEGQSHASEGLDTQSIFAGSPPPGSYIRILQECLPKETLTKRERRMKVKTLKALRELHDQMEETKIRRDLLLEESRQLQQEMFLEEKESQAILNYLEKENKDYERRCEEMWKKHFQPFEELKQTRRELAFRYSKEKSDLKAQLLRHEKLQANLEKKLQSLSNIAAIKESQDRKIQSLQEKIKRIPDEICAADQEAHLCFLQQKVLMEENIKELDQVQKQLKKGERKGLTGKAQELVSLAWKSHDEFCRGIHRQNQEARKQLQLLLQEVKKLEADQIQLEKRKQRLKEEQWYQDSVIRGRQRLQAVCERQYEREWQLEEQGAVKMASHSSHILPQIRPKSKGPPKHSSQTLRDILYFTH